MSNEQAYNLGRVAAIACTVASEIIIAATGLADLGLSRQAVAILSLVNVGLVGVMPFLPQANKAAGTVRGS